MKYNDIPQHCETQNTKNNRETQWNATTSLFWWLFDAGLKALIPRAAQQLQVVPNVHGLGGKHRGCAVQGARLMNTTSAPIPWHVSYILNDWSKWFVVFPPHSCSILVSIFVESSWFDGSTVEDREVTCFMPRDIHQFALEDSIFQMFDIREMCLKKRWFSFLLVSRRWSKLISGKPLISLIPVHQRSKRWSSNKGNNLICFSKRQHTNLHLG